MLTSWSQNLLATFLASSELKSKRPDGDNGQTSFWMIDISEPGGGWHWPWGAEWVLLLKLFRGGDEYHVVQGFWPQHFDKEGTEWLLNCFDQECPGLSVDKIHSAQSPPGTKAWIEFVGDGTLPGSNRAGFN